MTKSLASKIAEIDDAIYHSTSKAEKQYLRSIRKALKDYKGGRGSDKAELKRFNKYFKAQMATIGKTFKKDYTREANHKIRKALVQYEEDLADGGLFSALYLNKVRVGLLTKAKAEVARKITDAIKGTILGDTLALGTDLASSISGTLIDTAKDISEQKIAQAMKAFSPLQRAQLSDSVNNIGDRYNKKYAKVVGAGPMGVEFGRKNLRANHFTLDMHTPQRILDSSIDEAINNLNSAVTRNSIRAVNLAYMEAEPSERNIADLTTEVSFRLGKTKNQVRAFVNTSMSIARENSRDWLEEDYSDFISGWEFDAHLDKRTTQGCHDRDKQRYMKKSPNDTKRQTVPADSLVPRHYNCRSMLIPIPYKDGEEWKLIEDEEYREGNNVMRKRKWVKRIV